MSLRRRMGGTCFTRALLTMVVLLLASTDNAVGSDSNKEDPTGLHRSEIKKMQVSLRDKGHYRGTIDGVFGLRTRASIRAYQKAEKWPVTGEVDSRTAEGLGVRSDWGNGMGSGGTGTVAGAGERVRQEKPSAAIGRSKIHGWAGSKPPVEHTSEERR